MMMPVRIQRKRIRGWKKPPNTVYINRGTPYGSPFIVDPDAEPGQRRGVFYVCVPTVDDAMACYREMVNQSDDLKDKIKRHLKGKNLACFCEIDQPCHGDILLEVANA